MYLSIIWSWPRDFFLPIIELYVEFMYLPRSLIFPIIQYVLHIFCSQVTLINIH